MKRTLPVYIALAVLFVLSANADEKKGPHEPGGENPMPAAAGGHATAPAECPTKNKATLFDNKPSTERQVRFTPIMKNGKLDKLHVQICKGDPLSCVGNVSEWKWVVQDRDLQLSKDDQVLVEQALKKDGKYLFYPDRNKEEAKRKELDAFEKVARHIVSNGTRLDPGTFEPKPVKENSNEAAMLTGFFQPKPEYGAVIHPLSASDSIWYFPENEERLKESSAAYKKDESNLANQVYQSLLFAGKGLAGLKEQMRNDKGADLKRLHQIRLQIAPSVAFLKSVLKQHADENGRAKVQGSEFAEIENDFWDSRKPAAMLLRMDAELEQVEQVTIAQDPNQACILEQGKPANAPDFSKVQLPQAEKNPEFTASIAIGVDYGRTMKALDDKDPKVREAALEYFKNNPSALKTAKDLLSELYSARDKEPSFNKKETVTRGGKKFISDEKAQVYGAFPDLKGKPLTFENVRKYLMEKGHLDSIQFQLYPKDGGFTLQMSMKKGRRKAGWGEGSFQLKPGADGKLHIPYGEIINTLAAQFGGNGYNEYGSRLDSQFREAQKKEDEQLKEELNRGIDDLLKLQQELGGGKKAAGPTGER